MVATVVQVCAFGSNSLEVVRAGIEDLPVRQKVHTGIERWRPGGAVLRAPSRAHGIDLNGFVRSSVNLILAEKVINRPSPRLVTVGYQRPCAMFWTSVNVFVEGSKMDDFSSPKNGSYCTEPPLINARPSESTTMPLQNISQAVVNLVMVAVMGSNRRAPELFAGP